MIELLTIAIFILALLTLAKSVRIVKQYEKGLIIRLGKYRATVDSGINFIVPYMETLIHVDLREKVINVEPQKVITKDNVSVLVDAVIYFKVVDPVKAEFEIQDFNTAATTLAQSNLRNLIGDKQLDEVLVARDAINTSLRNVLDEATDHWGVKVTRVEVQKIDPPQDITDAMSKQMKAEREKRAVILEAEGLKQENILVAEGKKQRNILEAEGQAAAILRKAEAEAKAIEQVSTAAEKYFKDRAEARQKLDVLTQTLSRNTKYIIPAGSELVNVLGLDDPDKTKLVPLTKKK